MSFVNKTWKGRNKTHHGPEVHPDSFRVKDEGTGNMGHFRERWGGRGKKERASRVNNWINNTTSLKTR